MGGQAGVRQQEPLSKAQTPPPYLAAHTGTTVDVVSPTYQIPFSGSAPTKTGTKLPSCEDPVPGTQQVPNNVGG